MTALTAQSLWEIKRQFRNKRFIVFTLFIPLFYYFLFVHLNGASMKIGGTQWSKYFMMSMAAFSVIGSAINSLAARLAFERTQGWMKLMRTTPLPPSSYAGSKILGQTVIGILSILVIFIAAAVGEGVQLPVLQWVESILWIAIGSFPFMALGILIGLVGGVEGSAMIGNGVYFILSILGGLWWPLKMMPAWIQALAKWTPTFSLGDGAWKIVAGKSIGLHDISVLTLSFLVLLLLIVWMARRNLSLSA